MLTYEYMRSLRLKLVSVQSHCTDDDAGGGAGVTFFLTTLPTR